MRRSRQRNAIHKVSPVDHYLVIEDYRPRIVYKNQYIRGNKAYRHLPVIRLTTSSRE